MGCDIHCYIEYRSRDKNDEDKKWRSFGGRINPDRNYLMFWLMADVRGYGNSGLFKPKGLPEGLSYSAEEDNLIYITDDKKCECGECGCVSAEKAAKWVKSGSSEYKYNSEGKITWVTHPDWHSHSWLSLEEFRQVLEAYKVEEQKEWEELEKGRLELLNSVEESKRSDSWVNVPCKHNLAVKYQAIEAVMSRFEELGYESRLVFWFDN